MCSLPITPFMNGTIQLTKVQIDKQYDTFFFFREIFVLH